MDLLLKKGLDIAIYDNYDKKIKLAIEVGGFSSHNNNPKQLKRDKLKNSIFNKSGVNLLRLNTVGSEEWKKIQQFL